MASIDKIGDKWRVRVRVKPHKPESRKFDDERAARAWGAEREAELYRQTQATAARLDTVAGVIAGYRELREDAGRTIKAKSNEFYQLKRLEEFFAGTRLEALDNKALIDFCKVRRLECSPYSVGQDLSKLGTVIKYFCAYNQQPDPLPIKRAWPLLVNLKLVAASVKRRDVLWSDNEIACVLDYFLQSPYTLIMHKIFRFALVTGLRREEICALKWADVDEQNGVITVRQAKHPRDKENNDEQRAVMYAEVYEILDELPRLNEYVFGGYKSHNVTSWMTRAKEDLEITNRRFHDTRHNFVTSLAKKLNLAAAFGKMGSGHDTNANYERYLNIRPQDVSVKRPRT